LNSVGAANGAKILIFATALIASGEPRGPKTELRLSPEQTVKAVEPSGLKLVHLVEVPPYHNGAVFERPST
jgi:hypothetical protein